MRIREDIETKPIEINVQSAGFREDEQIFYTADDDETEEQIWERKEQSRQKPLTDQPTSLIDTFSVNFPRTRGENNKKPHKAVQIVVDS